MREFELKVRLPGFEIVKCPKYTEALTVPERMARLCYDSGRLKKEGSAERLVSSVLQSKPLPHDSIIEHESVSVILRMSRRTATQLTRHRKGVVFSQQSLRFIDLRKNKRSFQVILPSKVRDGEQTRAFLQAAEGSFRAYQALLDCGAAPEDASDVLPGATVALVGMTGTLQAFRHILTARCHKAASNEMRRVMVPLLLEMRERVPVVFDDVEFSPATDANGGSTTHLQYEDGEGIEHDW